VTQPIRTAVIGLSHAATVHVPALQAHPRFQLAAVASSRPGRAVEVARQRNVDRACEDWHEALADPSIDLVVAASSVPARTAQIQAALAAGKHVLAEPPLAESIDELDALLAEARRAERVAAACFPLRYLSARQALRELVCNGHLGTVRYASWRQFSATWHPTAPVHAVDTLRWTLGGVEHATVHRLKGDDALYLQCRHAGGCVTQVVIDGDSPTEDFSFTIAGTGRAAMVIGDHPDVGELHLVAGEVDDEYAVRPSPYQRFAAAHRHVPPMMELLDDLAAAIDGKVSTVPTMADAAEAQRIAGR